MNGSNYQSYAQIIAAMLHFEKNLWVFSSCLFRSAGTGGWSSASRSGLAQLKLLGTYLLVMWSYVKLCLLCISRHLINSKNQTAFFVLFSIPSSVGIDS